MKKHEIKIPITKSRNPVCTVADRPRYKYLTETSPRVNTDTRLGWLYIKRHFGPISLSEVNEIVRLERNLTTACIIPQRAIFD